MKQSGQLARRDLLVFLTQNVRILRRAVRDIRTDLFPNHQSRDAHIKLIVRLNEHVTTKLHSIPSTDFEELHRTTEKVWTKLVTGLSDTGIAVQDWFSVVAPQQLESGIVALQDVIATLKEDISKLPNEDLQQAETGPLKLIIVWNPHEVDPHDYAEVVNSIGDLVRSYGGLGLKLIKQQTMGVAEFAELPR